MLDEIEAGHVGAVITKDLSRLGRNSALTGLYINYTFPQNNVRYIAINDHFDSINPNSTDSDIAGIKNWFNEFFAKDTSRKIHAVQKAKGERGERLIVHVPYGYMKNPENPKEWIIDIEDLEQFIPRARRYTDLTELTPYVLRELIKAVYVEAPDKSSGKRKQRVHIEYDLVGYIPVNELIKAEQA